MPRNALAASVDQRVVRRALVLSTLDGLFHAAMMGLGESYLGALAVELGHRGTALAVLATLPVLLGALAQLASGQLSQWLGSRKRLVVAGAMVQALSHAGLVMMAASAETRFLPLLSYKCLFWISGMLIAPAWGGWMASLIDQRARQRFFALRSASAHTVLLATFLGAGLHLHSAAARAQTLAAYAELITGAMVARLLSALALAFQPDPYAARDGDGPPPYARIKRALTRSRFRVALYLAALMFGAHVSVPFFTPYMLRTLALSYEEYASLSAISILAKALTFPFCHLVSTRFGLRPTLIVGGLGVASVPYIWTFAQGYTDLIGVHVLGGVAWAGLEYSSYQLLLEDADGECRVEFLSLASSLSGFAQVAGALIGGQLLERAFDYRQVFTLSSVARALPLVLLVSLPARHLPKTLPRLFMRLFSVRPIAGALRRPILDDHPSRRPPPRQAR
jgi:MFS family permease